MRIHPDEISSILKEKINDFKFEIDISETGKVVQVGDGIARVYGMDNIMAGEMIEFPGGVVGMALNLEQDSKKIMWVAFFLVKHTRSKKVILPKEPKKSSRFQPVKLCLDAW